MDRVPRSAGYGHRCEAAIPERWSETENVRWKVPVHGRAWSSPVVLGRQIWLTTATPDGKQLYAMAFDKETGKTLYDLKLFDVATPQFAHAFNTYASPTPSSSRDVSTSPSARRARPPSIPRRAR
jgi:outer membrane protein assembly factor BamB